MGKIGELTEEQKAKLPVYRDHWIKIGLAEESSVLDNAKAERAVKLVYTCAGLKEPKKFIWTDSPLHSGICYALFRAKASVWNSVRSSVGKSVGESVENSVRKSVWNSVRSSVGKSVRESVENSVWKSVWNSVGSSVRKSVRESVENSVWDSVGSSVWDSVRKSVGDSVRDSCFGSHDVSWLSFYSYFHHELNIDCNKLAGLWDAALNCGWFIPFKDLVIISPRPKSIKTQINSRGNHELHADGIPAVYYCDDLKIYANSGVRLPEKYGAAKTTDWQSKWLLEEKNAELKMILIKNIGYEKIMQDLEAKKLDSWREYELYRIAQNVDVEPIHLLKMVCPSTKKIHVGRVPPSCMFAREAATLRNGGIDPEMFGVEQ